MNEKRSSSVEVKVGLFFLIGLVILAAITFKVENLGAVFQPRYRVLATFPHAAGLKKGDTVAVNGLSVGEIERIDLIEEGVRVAMQVESRATIREDATAKIAWSGLLGNRYVDIEPGSPDAPKIASGAEIESGPSIELEAILRKVDEAAGEVQTFLAETDVGGQLGEMTDRITAIADDIRNEKGTIGKLVGSDELYEKALAMVDDLQSSADRVERLVSENEERMDNILKSLDEALPQAEEALTSVKNLAKQAEEGEGLLGALLTDKKMREDFQNGLDRLSASLDRIENFTKDLEEGKGLASRLVKDEELANDLGEAVASLKAVAERIEKGDNTVARLTRDDDMYRDVKKLVDDLRETLRRVKEQVPIGTFASVLTSAF